MQQIKITLLDNNNASYGETINIGRQYKHIQLAYINI